MIDGTTIQLPETKKNNEYFDANKNRSDGKRQETTMEKASALFDVSNDNIIDAVIGKRYASERTQAEKLLKRSPIDLYNGKTNILFDRGYPANALYSYFIRQNGLFLMRVSEQSYNSTKEMPLGDQLYILHVMENYGS